MAFHKTTDVGTFGTKSLVSHRLQRDPQGDSVGSNLLGILQAEGVWDLGLLMLKLETSLKNWHKSVPVREDPGGLIHERTFIFMRSDHLHSLREVAFSRLLPQPTVISILYIMIQSTVDIVEMKDSYPIKL